MEYFFVYVYALTAIGYGAWEARAGANPILCLSFFVVFTAAMPFFVGADLARKLQE